MSDTLWIRWLDAAVEADRAGETGNDLIALVGGKGANLRRLLHLGLPVPPGFVITTEAYRAFLTANDLHAPAAEPASLAARIAEAPVPDGLRAAVLAAYERLGAGLVAVRSSGTAEDLATASFAGQHDTFLNVYGPVELLAAVRACWASLWTPRAVAYRREHGWDEHAGGPTERVSSQADDSMPLALAVVVQVMVPAEAAGVVFTANPLTGDRTETTISAVRGLGERLVSGKGVAEEWVVRGGGTATKAILRRQAEGVLTAEQVLAVARLARRIEGQFGTPQDVEWAIDAGGKLFVLQARPMTALPEPVTWTAPGGGGWMRNFRLGEWLPEPVTPLAGSWLLIRMEEGEVDAEAREFGLRPRPPYHVVVNGWYYSSPIGGGLPLRGVATALARHPLRIAALAFSTSRPDVADRLFIASAARRWRAELLPRYQRLIALWQARIETASPIELVQAIDAVGSVAGEYLWDLSVIGGHAWKAEHALARFCHRHLPDRAIRGHQSLLLGLPTPLPETPSHAVQSLDWIRPTLGEALPRVLPSEELTRRRTHLMEERRTAEAACRKELAARPRLRRRFDALLALAQRYAMLREEQAGWFTLGWPLLRRAVLRLGDALRLRGVIEQAEDVFFLTRLEVDAGLAADQVGHHGEAGDLRAAVAARRDEWGRQRRLSPPLLLGRPLSARVIARATDAMRTRGTVVDDHPDQHEGQDVLRGMPASPGLAAGAVRVIRGPDDFDRFQPGEVLVAQVTAPAWTPLFGLAAAVVTDGGSLAAHASLVAREYGIPAVVGAGDATARLCDGQRVLVDGSAGVVTVLR